NSAVVVRGHATPIALLERFKQAGLSAGKLQQGSKPSELKAGGKTIHLDRMDEVLAFIAANDLVNFEDGQRVPLKEAVKQLDDLPRNGVAAVRRSVETYAANHGLVLEKSQIFEEAVGVREPAVPNPQNEDQSAPNRRVEFRILKVPPDKVVADEFNL